MSEISHESLHDITICGPHVGLVDNSVALITQLLPLLPAILFEQAWLRDALAFRAHRQIPFDVRAVVPERNLMAEFVFLPLFCTVCVPCGPLRIAGFAVRLLILET